MWQIKRAQPVVVQRIRRPVQLKQSLWITVLMFTVQRRTNQRYGPNPNKNIQPGTTASLLGCVAPSIEQPTFNKAAHVAAMTTTGAGSSNTYTMPIVAI